MSAPVAPSEVKSKIPGLNGNFCEKFVKSLGLGKDIHALVSYFFKDDGTFTDEFIADWCLQASCNQTGGGGNGTGLRVDATDGLADHILVTWTTVPGALTYDLYRSNTDNFSQATIVSGSNTGLSYNDTTVTVGTFYYYWVRANSATAILATSDSDRGYAGELSTNLAPVTDLATSKGFAPGIGQTIVCSKSFGLYNSAVISLVWTPVAGASGYDIYRSDTDDLGTLNLIDGNRTPFDNTFSFLTGTQPVFIDNGGELVYLHNPGEPAANYYKKFFFWVVAKRSSPSAISYYSNNGSGAPGWAAGFGDGVNVGGATLSSDFAAVTVPASVSKLHLALRGSGAGGAGGGAQFGGGGGGGGPMITGWINVVTGAKFRVVSVPPTETANAPNSTSGDAGSLTKVQYSANGLFTDTVDVMTANVAGGGVYNPAGSGAGGAGSTGTVHASVQEPYIFDGRDGKPSNGFRGGRSGHHFGSYRLPGAHFNGFNPLTSYPGNGGIGTGRPGSGSDGNGAALAFATGGKGAVGFLVYNFET